MRLTERVTPGKDKFMANSDDHYNQFVTNLQKKL